MRPCQGETREGFFSNSVRRLTSETETTKYTALPRGSASTSASVGLRAHKVGSPKENISASLKRGDEQTDGGRTNNQAR